MKKIFILLIATLFSLSLFGQNKFNYEIQAKGGLSIGDGQVKIDSIVKFGSTIKFFSLGSELTIGTSSDSLSTNFNSGTVLSWDSDDVTLTHSANTLTLAGGDLALGSNDLTTTGDIGASGSEVNHIYADTLTVTNSIDISTIVPMIHSAAGDTSNYNTPDKIGDLFIDTSASKVYVSVEAARGGWVILNVFLLLVFIKRKKK